MKVKLPTEDKVSDEKPLDGPHDDPNEDVLPPAEEEPAEETPLEPEEPAEPEEPKLTALQLENERLKGKLEGIESVSSRAPAGPSQEDRDTAVRQQCLADIGSLDDESFQTKYRMSKLQANNAINEYDKKKDTTRNAMRIAELEAKSDLLTKYPSLNKHFDKIKQIVKSELSEEAQQDPARLKRAMERELLLLEKDAAPAPKKTKEDPMRRRIVDDFHKPNQDPNKGKERENKDEIAPELAEIGKRFGITSEAQRKKFMNPFIPMDLGGGYKFEDPKRGFERSAPK